jgi:predicted transcriptional regulator
MKTVELRDILIQKIALINDETVLNAIRTIIDLKTESTIYKTSNEQKLKIQEGIDQIESGNNFSNEQVESEIDKWLEEK